MVFITTTTSPIVLATDGLIFEKGDPGNGGVYVNPSPWLTILKQDGI